LNSELSGEDLTQALHLLRREDVETPDGVDRAAMESRVDDFRRATHRDDLIDTGTEDQDMLTALRGRSQAELAEMNRIYQERYGRTLEEEITSELEEGGPNRQIALNYLHGEAGLPAEIPEGR